MYHNNIKPAPGGEPTRPHSDFGMPMALVPTDRYVQQGMQRLEKLVADAEELNARLREAFGSVVVEKPASVPGDLKAMPQDASDLAKAVMRIADRLSSEFASMRHFTNSSDV